MGQVYWVSFAGLGFLGKVCWSGLLGQVTGSGLLGNFCWVRFAGLLGRFGNLDKLRDILTL